MSYQKNTLLILILSIFTVMWGTGWQLPLLNINSTEFFIPIIFLLGIYYVYKYQLKIKINFIFNYLVFFILILIYFYIGLLKNQFTLDSIEDTKYLINYTIKLVIFPFLFIFVPIFIKNKSDLIKFVKFSALIFIPLYIFLHYRFIYQLEVNFVGVSTEGNGKIGKNSFGGAIALLYPLFLAAYLTQQKKSKAIFLGLFLIFISAIYINSRSMILVMLVESIVFILFTHSNKIKKLGVIFIAIGTIILTMFFINDIKKVFYKDRYSEITISSNMENDSSLINRDETMFIITGMYDFPYYFINSHRGWLLYEAVEGIKNSYFFGNGISSFRIRDSNNNHKTDTHNDFLLVIYETGLIGLIFISVLFVFFITKIRKLLKSNNDFFLEASLANTIGIITFMAFTNILASSLLWLILSINLSIINYNQKKV